MANFNGMDLTFNPNFNVSYKGQTQPDVKPDNPPESGGTGTPGKDGKDGASAYQIAVQNGFNGTEVEWLKSLQGKDGKTPEKGKDYFTPDEIEEIATAAAEKVSAPTARIGYVTLLAAEWQSEESPYSQIVNIDGVTENTQVDLTPNVEQLSVFYNKDLAFVTENNNGVVTVYAIGQKPLNDYVIQVTMTEVNK